MSIHRKIKNMQREPRFHAVAFLSLSWLVSQRALRPRVPDSVLRCKGLSFVLSSDGMADSSQLSCTCHWLSVSQGQILLSVSTVRRTLQSVFLGWAGSIILDAMKHAVTDLVSNCLWNPEPVPPISTISWTILQVVENWWQPVWIPRISGQMLLSSDFC